MAFSNQPVVRDTSLNSGAEIVRRLANLLLGATLVLGPLLALLSLSGRDESMLIGAWICAAVFVVLLLTRRWWSHPAQSAAAPDTAAAKTVPANTAAPSPAPDANRAGDRRRVLLLDASLNGPGGNSSRALDTLAAHLAAHAEVERVALSGPEARTFAQLEPALRSADAFVFASGTHWDSWSSALQKFLEDATPAEATALWLGKPAAVVITEHSVGGKAVLSRLQGVLCTLGCSIPPLSGIVLAKAGRLAETASPAGAEDFWCRDDLRVVAHNVLLAASLPPQA